MILVSPSSVRRWTFLFNNMKVVVQRVSQAILSIKNQQYATIGCGMVVLIGIEAADTIEDIEWLANKMVNLRIFNDDEGIMNKSLMDIEGELLLVSQFTLHASTKKGNRPSYIKAARPETAIPMYKKMIEKLNDLLKTPIETGEFGANMQVSLINDGPVTIVIDTKNKA